jgi:hypothetical protein
VTKVPKSNQALFQYKPSDWKNAQSKLWNSHLFKDFGVQRLSEYPQQTITLSRLESLFEATLQIKFTLKEIAALVSELRCTSIVYGEHVIQYPLLLTELKLLGLLLSVPIPPHSISRSFQVMQPDPWILHSNSNNNCIINSSNTRRRRESNPHSPTKLWQLNSKSSPLIVMSSTLP